MFIASDSNNELYFVIKIDASRSEFLLENNFEKEDFPFLISKVDIEIIENVFKSRLVERLIHRTTYEKSWDLFFNEIEERYVLKREGNGFIENVLCSEEKPDFILKISRDSKDLLFSDKLKRYLELMMSELVLSTDEYEFFSKLVINKYQK